MSNLSKEEKKAIKNVEKFVYSILNGISANDCKILLNYIARLQKELEQEKENNEKQIKIDTAEEVLKWKGKYHLLSRKINVVSKDKIREYIKENKRIYEMKTPNKNRVVYKPCVLLTKEAEDLLKEN